MPDTVRPRADILALFPDNTAGLISPQDQRDNIVSTLNRQPATAAENTITPSVGNIPGVTVVSFDGSGNLLVCKSDASTTTFTVSSAGVVTCDSVVGDLTGDVTAGEIEAATITTNDLDVTGTATGLIPTANVHGTGVVFQNLSGQLEQSELVSIGDVNLGLFGIDENIQVALNSFMETATATFLFSGKQDLDDELTAIAGLTSAADKLPYFTGAGTADVTTLTSFARGLLDDANNSTARTTLGVAIGTDVQGYSAKLAALAGQTWANDTITYQTSTSAVSATALTSFARTLLDDADQATMKTTLGLVIGTNVQAYDAELAAIASTSSASNTVPYYTGTGTASTTNFTAAGRSLVGLSPSTDNMAYFSSSSAASLINTTAGGRALLGVSASTDVIPYFTGSSTVSAFSSSSAGRAMCAISGSTDAAPYFTSSSNVSTYSTTQGGRSLVGLAGSTDAAPYYTSSSSVSTYSTTTGGRALVGTTGAANAVPYWTSSSATSTFTSTAGGRALVGVTGVTDTIAYYTSSSAATTTSLTSFGRSLIDDTSAENARITLEINQGDVYLMGQAFP